MERKRHVLQGTIPQPLPKILQCRWSPTTANDPLSPRPYDDSSDCDTGDCRSESEFGAESGHDTEVTVPEASDFDYDEYGEDPERDENEGEGPPKLHFDSDHCDQLMRNWITKHNVPIEEAGSDEIWTIFNYLAGCKPSGCLIKAVDVSLEIFKPYGIADHESA